MSATTPLAFLAFPTANASGMTTMLAAAPMVAETKTRRIGMLTQEVEEEEDEVGE